MQHLGAAIAHSRELILAPRCCYGGFSPEVKRALDRSISQSLPFFTYRGGRLHHTLRYHRAPDLTVCFYGPMTDFERETGSRMAQANRVNMGCPSLRLLFAEGHLPATITMFGALTPLVLLRCFLLNGGLGLAFGWLYRKYGIQYAMIGHAGTHIISKLIWLVLI